MTRKSSSYIEIFASILEAAKKRQETWESICKNTADVFLAKRSGILEKIKFSLDEELCVWYNKNVLGEMAELA